MVVSWFLHRRSLKKAICLEGGQQTFLKLPFQKKGCVVFPCMLQSNKKSNVFERYFVCIVHVIEKNGKFLYHTIWTMEKYFHSISKHTLETGFPTARGHMASLLGGSALFQEPLCMVLRMQQCSRLHYQLNVSSHSPGGILYHFTLFNWSLVIWLVSVIGRRAEVMESLPSRGFQAQSPTAGVCLLAAMRTSISQNLLLSTNLGPREKTNRPEP